MPGASRSFLTKEDLEALASEYEGTGLQDPPWWAPDEADMAAATASVAAAPFTGGASLAIAGPLFIRKLTQRALKEGVEDASKVTLKRGGRGFYPKELAQRVWEMLPANAVDSVKDILGLQAKEYVSHRTRVSTHGMHEIPERTIRVSRPRASGEAVIKSPKKAVIQHPDGTVSYMIPSYSRGKMLGDPSFELAGGLGSLVGDQWYRVLPQQLTDELEELARRELALYYNKRNKPWKSKAPADLAREWIGHMAAENIGAPNLTAGIPREFTSKIAPLLKRSQARETVKGEMEIAQEVARRQAEHEAQKLSTTEAILNKLNTLRRRILRGAEPLPTQQADIEEATKVLQGLLGTKPPEGGI